MSIGNRKMSRRNDLKKHSQENKAEHVGMRRINWGFQKNLSIGLFLLLDRNNIRKIILCSGLFFCHCFPLEQLIILYNSDSICPHLLSQRRHFYLFTSDYSSCFLLSSLACLQSCFPYSSSFPLNTNEYKICPYSCSYATNIHW